MRVIVFEKIKLTHKACWLLAGHRASSSNFYKCARRRFPLNSRLYKKEVLRHWEHLIRRRIRVAFHVLRQNMEKNFHFDKLTWKRDILDGKICFLISRISDSESHNIVKKNDKYGFCRVPIMVTGGGIGVRAAGLLNSIKSYFECCVARSWGTIVPSKNSK